MDNQNHANFRYVETAYAYDDYMLHCHNYYEVYYFLAGDVNYVVEGLLYKPEPHNILLLPPGSFHGVKVNTPEPYRRYTLHFHPDILSFERKGFLMSIFPSLKRREGQKILKNANEYSIPVYLEALAACNDMDENKRAQMMPICIEALLCQIAQILEKCEEIPETTQQNAVSEIIWYINRHLKDKITLDDLSESFYISKHHLNKIFKKNTGTTIFDYLTRKRIQYAQHLLSKGMNAQQAAMQSGFNDYSTFYRSYIRVLGYSPSQDKPSIHVDENFDTLSMENIDLN